MRLTDIQPSLIQLRLTMLWGYRYDYDQRLSDLLCSECLNAGTGKFQVMRL